MTGIKKISWLGIENICYDNHHLIPKTLINKTWNSEKCAQILQCKREKFPSTCFLFLEPKLINLEKLKKSALIFFFCWIKNKKGDLVVYQNCEEDLNKISEFWMLWSKYQKIKNIHCI